MGKKQKVFRWQKVIGKCAPKFPVIIFPQLWKRNTSKIPQSSRLKGILSIQSLSSMTSHRLLCTENNFWAVKKKALIHKSKYKKPNLGDITAECVMLILRVIKNTLKEKSTRILGEKQTQSSTYHISLNWLTNTIEEINSNNKKSHQNQKIRLLNRNKMLRLSQFQIICKKVLLRFAQKKLVKSKKIFTNFW